MIMLRCLSLCIVLMISRNVRGDIGNQMAEVIQKCCDDGSGYARNHTGQDCNIPVAPADVPSAFGPLCVIAQAQCCRDYIKKSEDCDSGLAAFIMEKCNDVKDYTKLCCDECSRGSKAGLAGGTEACVPKALTGNADGLLSNDAFVKCCLKAAQEGPPKFMPKPVTLASVCEDYAPNELCAHHCIPIPGSYKCECNPGFMLMTDGRNCKEVVKNRCKPQNPCQHKCNDNGIEVLCSCRRGYELMPDGKSCQDINECQLDIPVCRQGTKCLNLHGSYRCIQEKPQAPRESSKEGKCPPGYARNFKNNACDDINECKLTRPPCPAYLCQNTVGGYKCGGVSGDPVNLSSTPRSEGGEDRCPPGFALGSHGECEDVDECASLKDDCNRLSQFCVNTHSTFYCQDMSSKHCPPGFKIDTMTNRCEDINECEDDAEICRKDQICINQLGQYDCKENKLKENRASRHWCPDGMRINPTTHLCEDIDECTEGTHLCDQHQNCFNNNGSFECHCKFGYELDTATGACVDVNECATQQHDCILNSQRCDNTIGSYLCIRITSCGTGYILQHSTGKCEDVDECALGTHNCAIAGPEYQCMNIPGSFRCVRKRVTTTTAAPSEYEYEYYDSEEEVDGKAPSTNETSSPAAIDVPYTSPNPVPTPSSSLANTKVTPLPGVYIPEERKPDVNLAEDRDPGVNEPKESISEVNPEKHDQDEPKNSKPEINQHEESKPEVNQVEERDRNVYVPEESKPVMNLPQNPEGKPEEYKPTTERIPTFDHERDNRKPIDHIPEVPRYISPLYTDDRLKPSDPPVRTPEITYTEPPEPANRPDIVYEPNSEPTERKESSDSIYYDTRPDKSVSTNEIQGPEQTTDRVPEPNTELKQEVPSQRPTYSPYRPTARTVPTSPNAVVISVGKETHSKDYGLVSGGNKDPEQDWSRNTERPSDCPPGFEASDNGGCFDIDECSTSRHSCSGFTETCRNTIGGYLCDCASGFRRDMVTGACALIFASSTASVATVPPPPPTLPPTTPSTTPEPIPSSTERELFFGYPDDRPLTTRPFWSRNKCDAGFHLDAQTGKCEDINECTNGQANCAAVEVCMNTRGGYLCECPPNWRLDDVRHRCVPVRNMGIFPSGYGNEPALAPADPIEKIGHGSEATNQVNPEITQVEDRGTVLKCPWGYRLGDDNNCVDVDECVTGEAKCGLQQICTNLAGGYTCSCPRGHKLTGDHECEDVDECALAGNSSICSRNADCINTIGSYNCKCHTGFRSAPINDKVCVDVDECSEARSGSLCQHRCSNVWGSYRCSCHRGYRLSPDNRTCVDVDECVMFKAKIPCVGKCLNEPGSYRCACPIGYRLSEDKRSCIDIDECETGEASCQSGMFGGTSHVCFNTRGSYHCQRITCPNGYELESKHRCTKTERVCKPGDWECAHQPTTISYNFITFVSKLYVPNDNVKLFTLRGPAWPYTEMTFQLRLVNVNAPPSVRETADINAFLLTQSGHEAVISLVHPLEGPQSIELELSMELYSREQFGGIAIAKVFIYVSEYEF